MENLKKLEQKVVWKVWVFLTFKNGLVDLWWIVNLKDPRKLKMKVTEIV